MDTLTAQRPGTAADALDGVVPVHVSEPETPEAMAETIARASRERLQTVFRGGGTKLGWGRVPRAVDLVVSTARLNRLVAHRHGDLTVTVQAGMTLRDLNQALRGQQQWLPVESAFAGTTVGGLVATNEAGPSRHRNGTPRDLVIGITLAMTDGRLIKSGGTVVKNVAGYDLGKLVSGSHGTFAGIVDVTFKLVPIPAVSSTLVAMYSEADAAAMTRDVAALMASQVEPAAFDVAYAPGTEPYQFALRVATSPAATAAQIGSARSLVSAETVVLTGDDEWGLWSQHLAAPWGGDATVRLSWLPARLPKVLALVSGLRATDNVAATFVGRAAGSGLLALSGASQALTAVVNRLRSSPDVGHVVVLRAPQALKGTVDVWGPPRDSDRVLRSLKQMFDPAGILNAGRGPV